MFELLTKLDNSIEETISSFITIPASVLATGIGIFISSLVTAWCMYRSYLIMIGLSSESFNQLVKDLFFKCAIIVIASTSGEYTELFINPMKNIQKEFSNEVIKNIDKESDSIFSPIEKSIYNLNLMLTSITTANNSSKDSAVSELYNKGDTEGFSGGLKIAWAYIQDGVSNLTSVFKEPILIFHYLITLIKVSLLIMALIIFAISAFTTLVMHKIFFYVSLSVTPLFILFLAFNATRGYFMSWLSSTLGYGLSYGMVLLVYLGMMKIYSSIAKLDNDSGELTFYKVFEYLILFLIFSSIIQKIGNVVSSYFNSGNLSENLKSSMENNAKSFLERINPSFGNGKRNGGSASVSRGN